MAFISLVSARSSNRRHANLSWPLWSGRSGPNRHSFVCERELQFDLERGWKFWM